jgi:hypothetical protein
MTFRAATLSITATLTLGALAGCVVQPASPAESTSENTAQLAGSSVASIALANLDKGACSTNSEGGHAFDSSCTGNGGEPEYWCADFARWVWGAAGVSDLGGLTAAAGSFYVYGVDHGTLSNTPHVGDAVVFDYQGGGVADHVAIVTQVSGDSIVTASGDWGGNGSTEAGFSSTSHVIENSPAYPGVVGSSPSIMGMTISGFVSPVGLAGAPAGAPPSCSVGGVAGTCIETSACAAKSGYHASAGYCPGAADIECCTPEASAPSSSPDACNEAEGFCTETLQCLNGHWIIRADDSHACTSVQNVEESCNEGNGYCTATLQCDGDHWVPRSSDPNACTSGPG